MPATPSGSPACADADRPSRLADTIPGAITLRVSLTGPAWTWPEADWTCPRTVDLATATLIRSGLVAAVRGR